MTQNIDPREEKRVVTEETVTPAQPVKEEKTETTTETTETTTER
jgi:hypothetical protein